LASSEFCVSKSYGSAGLDEPGDETIGDLEPAADERPSTRVGGQMGTSAGILPTLCALPDGDAGGG
jgi:hypothetical protein